MKTEIVIITAIGNNGEIGLNNQIPWRIKEDMKRFKKLTTGHACLMGSKTYESLPEKFKPLPNRENLVLTRRTDYHPEGTKIFHNIKESIDYVNSMNYRKLYVIGGAQVYKSVLNIADTLEITNIYNNFDADTYFPFIRPIWKIIKFEHIKSKDLKNNKDIIFSFLTLKIDPHMLQILGKDGKIIRIGDTTFGI